MRICVVGAGAIGSLLGGRLAASGHEVGLLTRGEHLAAIRSDGLRIIDEVGTESPAGPMVADDDIRGFGPQDLLILALKAHQISQIADQLDKVCEEHTTVLTVQNGVPWWFFHRFGGDHEGYRLRTVDPEGKIERSIEGRRILGGIAYPAAERPVPGTVKVIEGDQFPVGELDGRRSERAEEIADALTQAGFRSRVLTDIRAHLWVKAWGNLAFNPISALTGCTLAEICSFPDTRRLAESMMHEAAAIADSLGIRTRLSIEKRIAAAAAVGDHQTSMLQDLLAGRELEVEALVGAFAELGELTGIPTPAIDAVYACVALLNSKQVQARLG